MASRSQAWIRTALIAAFFTGLAVANSYPLAVSPASRIGHHGDALFSVWRLAWVGHQLRPDPVTSSTRISFTRDVKRWRIRTPSCCPPWYWPLFTGSASHRWPFTTWRCSPRSCSTRWVWSALVHRTRPGLSRPAFWPASSMASPLFVSITSIISRCSSRSGCLLRFAWHRAVMSEAVKGYLLVAALAACQVLSCIYYGIFLLTWLPLITVVWFVKTPFKTLKACGWMLLPPLLVLALYSMPYLRNRENLGDRNLTDIKAWSAKISDFRSAPPANILYGWTNRLSVPERYLFPGVVATALVVIALWPPWDRLRLLHIAGLTVALQLTLGFNGVIYPLLHEWVLPYRGLRVLRERQSWSCSYLRSRRPCARSCYRAYETALTSESHCFRGRRSRLPRISLATSPAER